MAVTFRFPSQQVFGHVGFAYSPAMEAALSLRPVVNPKRHPMHLPWVRRTRDLSEDLRAEIDRLSFVFDNFLPGVFEVGLAGDYPTFEEELARIETFDDDAVLFELTMGFGGWHCVHDHLGDDVRPEPWAVHEDWYQERILAAAEDDDPEQAAILRTAFDDPATLRSRLAGMLGRYWDEAFAEEWDRIQPRLDAEIADASRRLVAGGVPALAAEFLPEARWEPDIPAIVLDKRHGSLDIEVDVAARGGLSIVPTVYGWPHVAVEVDPPWALSMIHPIRQLQQPEVAQASDHEVATGLRALGDETRLQISRLVAEQPRSTTELAELLSLSESSVSRHLKTLSGAGVLEAERDGYYVLYRLVPDRIGALGGALRRTLGLLPSPTTGPRQPLDVVNQRRAVRA